MVGTPLVALVGLLEHRSDSARDRGGRVRFGVAGHHALTLLLPFADLGIGAVVISACSRPGRLTDDGAAVATVQHGLRRLSLVAVALILISLVIMATNSWGFLLGSTAGPADRIAITIAACLIALAFWLVSEFGSSLALI